jgi:hypothetical protein
MIDAIWMAALFILGMATGVLIRRRGKQDDGE